METQLKVVEKVGEGKGWWGRGCGGDVEGEAWGRRGMGESGEGGAGREGRAWQRCGPQPQADATYFILRDYLL